MRPAVETLATSRFIGLGHRHRCYIKPLLTLHFSPSVESKRYGLSGVMSWGCTVYLDFFDSYFLFCFSSYYPFIFDSGVATQ